MKTFPLRQVEFGHTEEQGLEHALLSGCNSGAVLAAQLEVTSPHPAPVSSSARSTRFLLDAPGSSPLPRLCA